MVAVPAEYSGADCRYLWKLGSSTARIQRYPSCSVVPGPAAVLPLVGAVVALGVAPDVAVARVVEAVPGWHCE